MNFEQGYNVFSWRWIAVVPFSGRPGPNNASIDRSMESEEEAVSRNSLICPPFFDSVGQEIVQRLFPFLRLEKATSRSAGIYQLEFINYIKHQDPVPSVGCVYLVWFTLLYVEKNSLRLNKRLFVKIFVYFISYLFLNYYKSSSSIDEKKRKFSFLFKNRQKRKWQPIVI